jgi:hypothetical protein
MARFQYPSLTQPIFAGGESIIEDKWHEPWSEPVRSRIAPQLAVALIASGLAYVEAAPFAETVTESRWHQPWSEPVRVKPRLIDGAQQFLAPDPLPRVSFGWFNWLTEPVRVKAALPVVEQRVFAFEPTPIISIAWHLPFAEPVRVKPGLGVGAQQYLALQPWPDISIGWAPAFSEPVRIKPGLIAALQPYEVSYDVQPYPFLGGGGGWYLPGFAEATPGKPAGARRAKAGAPRQVAPKIEPPSFAEVIGNQQPARLADVLGSAFAPQLAALHPPALDLYVPPARAIAPAPQPLPRAVLDAAADHVDAIDASEALHALDMLERQEHEALIAILLHLASEES